MSLFSRTSPELPTADTALAGRDSAIAVPERHVVLGTPLVPPFPDGFERLVVGMGPASGAPIGPSDSSVKKRRSGQSSGLSRAAAALMPRRSTRHHVGTPQELALVVREDIPRGQQSFARHEKTTAASRSPAVSREPSRPLRRAPVGPRGRTRPSAASSRRWRRSPACRTPSRIDCGDPLRVRARPP